MPEIGDFKQRATTIGAFGDFSTVDLAMIASGGEPRMVKAGVVNGSFFEVMGLRPALGRLLTPQDDGPKAAGVAVLTYRFWTTAFNSDPTAVGKRIRLGVVPTTVIGVLEPSVPYPTETEIMANMVTSPHHLGATMVTRRTHRMTDLFGRLAPKVSIEAARAELTALHAAMIQEHPEAYSKQAHVQLRVAKLRRSDRGAGADDPARAPGRGGERLRDRVLQRGEPDSGAVGATRGGTGGACRARRQPRCAEAYAAG
jgi:putative ABC transport system permease protein